MSTFDGFISEVPGISVDCFVHRNRQESTVFFLSHCHTDHMQGLHAPEPLPGPLYTAPISAVFLKHRYPHLVSCIRTVDLRGPTMVDVPVGNDTRQLTVTAIPAGHCPGSVMFLFETDSGQSILYTGDFRLSPKDLRNIRPLKSLTLDALYLDTTFFNEYYRYFPTQAASLIKVVELCKEWLAADLRNIVSLKLPALYGSEFLFIELSRQLSQRIHVREQEARQYRFLASLDETITSDSSARIHACLRTSNEEYWKLPCRPELEARFVRVLRPSALRWRNLTEGASFWRRLHRDREEFGVCYSNHASCGELEDFLRYLTPKSIRFNVVPKGEGEAAIMNAMLKGICARAEDAREVVESPIKFDGIVYKKSIPCTKSLFSDDESSDEEAVVGQLPKRIRN